MNQKGSKLNEFGRHLPALFVLLTQLSIPPLIRKKGAALNSTVDELVVIDADIS